MITKSFKKQSRTASHIRSRWGLHGVCCGPTLDDPSVPSPPVLHFRCLLCSLPSSFTVTCISSWLWHIAVTPQMSWVWLVSAGSSWCLQVLKRYYCQQGVRSEPCVQEGACTSLSQSSIRWHTNTHKQTHTLSNCFSTEELRHNLSWTY